MTLTETLTHEWQSQLQIDCPTLSSDDRDSIVRWLIGEDVLRLDNLDADQFVVASFYISLEESPVKVDNLDADQFVVAREAMNYRYRILMQRYLGVQPEHAYRQLIQRLSSLFLIRSKIRDWVALSHDRQRTVADVLQEVIQELMQSDSYMQQQIAWIAQCTSNPRLRNSLTLASIEEYCLRPIRNQPLLVYRFVNYLRRSQRGGMTEVPTSDLIRFVSEEDILDDTKDPVNFLDAQAIAEYQYQQSQEEEAYLYNQVRDEFSSYLAEEVDPLAASWFELYLQGLSQEEIVKSLKIPIKQVYRLREKVAYHVRNFTRRSNSESVQILVADNFRDSRKYLELGRTYFESGDYEKTINAYQEALEVYLFEEVPQKWAQIQRGLAETYSRRIQGDRSENLELAIQHYQRALEVFTRETFPQEWAATQVDLARFHFQRIRGDRSDNLEQAIAACESALQVFTRETFPESWAQTQFLLAKIYYERIRGDRSENLERAIAVCQLAFQVYIREAFPEGWTKVQTILATAYSEKIQGDRVENLEQAINNLLQALEDEDSYVRRRAVEALGQIGSEQAIPKLLQSLNDEVSGVRWRVVEALERIGSEQAVLGLLRSLQDEDYDVRWRAVNALGNLGSEQALPSLLEALNDEASGVRWRAVAALERLGSEAAIPGLLRALEDKDSKVRSNAAEAIGKIAPTDLRVIDTSINLLHSEQDYEMAIALIDRAIQFHPDIVELYMRRSELCSELGRYEEAVASYDRVLELQPDSFQSWSDRGDALSNLGRYREAIASYDQALSIEPSLSSIWCSRGELLAQLGRSEEAITSYDKAIEINPDASHAWYYRGNALIS